MRRVVKKAEGKDDTVAEAVVGLELSECDRSTAIEVPENAQRIRSLLALDM